MSEQHALPLRTYLLVFAALLAGTALTVAVAYVDLGAMNDALALGIAGVKATIVVLWFMHVKFESNLTKVFAVAGFLWLALLLALTVADYASREWLPVYFR